MMMSTGGRVASAASPLKGHKSSLFTGYALSNHSK